MPPAGRSLPRPATRTQVAPRPTPPPQRHHTEEGREVLRVVVRHEGVFPVAAELDAEAGGTLPRHGRQYAPTRRGVVHAVDGIARRLERIRGGHLGGRLALDD